MPYKDPERRRDYDREYKRTSRTGGGPTPGQTLVPLPFRLKTAADVLKLLEEQGAAVRGEQNAATLEKARCIGYLAGTALKAIEAGDLAARLEAVEATLKAAGQEEGHIGLELVGEGRMRTLNYAHRGVDEATDVLAFPIDERDALPDGVPRQLGDVVLCPEVTGAEWPGALVHGVLHLLGYDHGSEMEAREAALR